VRIKLIPFPRYEGSVYPFQSGMCALVAPSKKATSKVDFLQACIVQETLELPHQGPIKAVIILVFCLIDQVKVPSKKPRT
jgi:hypothetical protein